MAQKSIKERLGATEKEIGEMRKELQRFPTLEKKVEVLSKEVQEGHKEMKAMLNQLVEGKTRATSLSMVTEISTGKRKNRAEDSEVETGDTNEEMEEGESSQVPKTEGRGDRIKKLEMSVFNGTDPDGWLFRAKLYFQMHRLTEEEKLTVVVIRFEGRANKWYRWAKNRQKFKTWESLKKRLFKKFLPSQQGTLCARFLSIQQETTMEEYCNRFEEWSAPLPQLTEEVLENTFTNGLDLEIRTKLFCLEPIGLESMMWMAQKIEDRITAAKQAHEFQTNKVQKVGNVAQTTHYPTRSGEGLQTRSFTLAEKVPFQRREHSV